MIDPDLFLLFYLFIIIGIVIVVVIVYYTMCSLISNYDGIGNTPYSSHGEQSTMMLNLSGMIALLCVTSHPCESQVTKEEAALSFLRVSVSLCPILSLSSEFSPCFCLNLPHAQSLDGITP